MQQKKGKEWEWIRKKKYQNTEMKALSSLESYLKSHLQHRHNYKNMTETVARDRRIGLKKSHIERRKNNVNNKTSCQKIMDHKTNFGACFTITAFLIEESFTMASSVVHGFILKAKEHNPSFWRMKRMLILSIILGNYVSWVKKSEPGRRP